MSDFKMRPAPGMCSDETINALFDLAVTLSKSHSMELQADPGLAAKLDADPAACMEHSHKLVAELFFHTKKRRSLPDIYECKNCDYQFPQEASCPKCDSTAIQLFMRAPSRSELRRTNSDYETELDELDPDWRDRFGCDAERAMDFYKPKPGRVIHSSQFEPPTYADDDVTFDDDLEDR